MEAGKRNIHGVYNRANKLKIPFFQRHYVWKKEQWERFLDDMKFVARTNTPYFMGSIILKQEATAANADNVRVVIDGQQRLTTFILFFKALFKRNKTPDIFKDIFMTYKGEIILDHNFLDKPIFNKIIIEDELSSEEKKSNLYACYAYFLNNIGENEIDSNHLLENISFVGIDLQPNEDEQQIFDTINSLGVRLTTAELLKNYLFNDHESMDSYNQNWLDVFESDNETLEYWDQLITTGRNNRGNIDVFLQAYLSIKIQDPAINVSAEDKERFYKVDRLFNSFKELVTKYNLTKQTLIDEIKEYALIYRKSINPEITDQEFKITNWDSRINLLIFGLETATVIPYILYLAKNVSNVSEREAIYEYLETYVIRRIICDVSTKDYNNLFKSFISNEIKTLNDLKVFIAKKAEKVNGMPTDDEVREGFGESELYNRQAKGVLYLLEKAIHDPNHSVDLKSFDQYSLEHVMPKKWENNWNNPKLTEEQAEARRALVVTLGNLTIITKKLNSSIRDADWHTKKTGQGENSGLSKCAQGLDIFSKYLELDTWDESVINKRANELADRVVHEIWKV